MSSFPFKPHTFLRTAVSLAVGAIMGSAIATTIGMLAAIAASSGTDHNVLLLATGGFGVGAVKGAFAGAPLALTAGWLAHLLFMALGIRGLLPYLGAAILIGAGASLAETLLAGHLPNTALVALDGLAGLIAGLIFWIGRRPDRENEFSATWK